MGVSYNTFNTGTDQKVTIIDLDSGVSVDIGGFLDDSEGTSEHDLITIKPCDRPTNVHRLAYGDYKVMLTVIRATGALDDLEAQNFSDFITSGTNHRYTVTGSVLNQADGSFNEYQYQNCLLWISSFGSYKKDTPVSMKVEIVAEQRVKVA